MVGADKRFGVGEQPGSKEAKVSRLLNDRGSVALLEDQGQGKERVREGEKGGLGKPERERSVYIGVLPLCIFRRESVR